MIKRTIALRYAKALFDLDHSKENLEKRCKNFNLLQELLEKNPKLRNFLKAPQIEAVEKEKLLQSLLKNEFDKDFFNFLIYLIENRRLNYLTQIGLEYRLIVDQFLNIWEAKITTAVPLEAETEAKLKQKLENFYHKKVKINNVIDPKIIGGAILVVANEMIDWSVANRLRKMKEDLLATNI